MIGKTAFFVYGTLLFQEIRFALLQTEDEWEYADLYGYRRFRINRKNRTAKGPAITRQRFGKVRGKLVWVPDDLANIFHLFEGFAGDYHLTDVTVVLVDGKTPVKAKAYVANSCLRKFLGRFRDDDWSEIYFAEKWLHHYLTERISGFLAQHELHQCQTDGLKQGSLFANSGAPTERSVFALSGSNGILTFPYTGGPNANPCE